ncbi:putative kelch-type beta propeller [Helianthus anomalus]
MYIFGGNHNGRYLNDLQTLDLRNWTWSRVEVKANYEDPGRVTPYAGHSLIPWEGNKLISIAGHSRDASEVINGPLESASLQVHWIIHHRTCILGLFMLVTTLAPQRGTSDLLLFRRLQELMLLGLCSVHSAARGTHENWMHQS